MWPATDQLAWSTQTEYVVAAAIGLAFGFFLEQGGFGNSRKLALVFYFRDMTVVKVMFTAIITAMTGTILLAQAGWLDLSAVWLVPSYLWPGIVGGVIMGAGFAIGGYCPGTAIVGCATLKTDAWLNVAGAALGMVIFAELFPFVEGFWRSGHLGDRMTLPEYFGWSHGLVGLLVIVMAVAMFAGSEWLEGKFGEPEPEPEPAAPDLDEAEAAE